MSRLATALAALVLSAGAALAQNVATIRFQNVSGATVYSVEASPADTTAWGGDLLENYVLYPGQNRDVTFVNVASCYYDVRITFTDWYSYSDVFDLCSFNQYNIDY